MYFRCFWKKSLLLTKKYNKTNNTGKWIYNLKQQFFTLIYIFKCNTWCKAEFSASLPFRNHSNMLSWCSRNIYYHQRWKQLIINNCIFFSWLMKRKFKNRMSLLSFFYQFNASLLNKSISKSTKYKTFERHSVRFEGLWTFNMSLQVAKRWSCGTVL